MNNLKNNAALFGCLGLVMGLVGSVAMQSYAASNDTATANDTASVAATSTAVTSADQTKTQGHRPLGGDGNITAINGNTITI